MTRFRGLFLLPCLLAACLSWAQPPAPTLVPQVGDAMNVLGIAALPDGSTLLTMSDDNMLRYWDVRTGELVRELRPPVSVADGETKTTNSAALSPDGMVLATLGKDKRVHRYHVPDFAPLPDLALPEGWLDESPVWALIFTPDCRVLVAMSYRMVVAFDLTAVPPKRIFSWEGDGDLLRVIPAPDDVTLAFVKGNGITLVDITGKTPPRRLTAGKAVLQGVAFLSDGKRVAAWGLQLPAKTVTLFSIATGKALQALTAPLPVIAITAPPDGTRLLTAMQYSVPNRLARIQVLPLDGTESRTLDTGYYSDTMGFTHDGLVVLNGAPNFATPRALTLWNVQTGQRVRRLGVPRVWTYENIIPERGQPASPLGIAAHWDRHTGTLVSAAPRPALPARPFYPTYSADATRMAYELTPSTLTVCDAATAKVAQRFPMLGSPLEPLGFSPDGAYVAAVAENGEKVDFRLWHLPDGIEQGVQPALGDKRTRALRPLVVCFSADMARVLIAGTVPGNTEPDMPQYVQCWARPATGTAWTLTAAWTMPGNGVMHAAFAADGHTVAVSAAEVQQDHSRVEIRDAVTGALAQTLDGAFGPLAFSPDGARLVGTTEEGAACWECATGRQLSTFDPAVVNHEPLTVAFTPGGRLWLHDGDTDTLWDVAQGRLLATLLLLDYAKDTSAEWIAYTPAGYYTGSAHAERYFRWRTTVAGVDTLHPGAEFQVQYRQPEKVAEALRE